MTDDDFNKILYGPLGNDPVSSNSIKDTSNKLSKITAKDLQNIVKQNISEWGALPEENTPYYAKTITGDTASSVNYMQTLPIETLRWNKEKQGIEILTAFGYILIATEECIRIAISKHLDHKNGLPDNKKKPTRFDLINIANKPVKNAISPHCELIDNEIESIKHKKIINDNPWEVVEDIAGDSIVYPPSIIYGPITYKLITGNTTTISKIISSDLTLYNNKYNNITWTDCTYSTDS